MCSFFLRALSLCDVIMVFDRTGALYFALMPGNIPQVDKHTESGVAWAGLISLIVTYLIVIVKRLGMKLTNGNRRGSCQGYKGVLC